MQLDVSKTNTIPIKISKNSYLVTIATAPNVAPRASDPVSPINTLAGFKLKTKKPSNDPIKIKQKIAINIKEFKLKIKTIKKDINVQEVQLF